MNEPHISYWNHSTLSESLFYAYRNGTRWEKERVEFSSGVTAICVDSMMRIHIVYTEAGNKHVKYALRMPDNPLPTSRVRDVSPHWRNGSPLDLIADARDLNGAVAQVDLHYRFDGGSGWGPWSFFASDMTVPFAWLFPWPDGEGRYEFYSLAFDGTDWEVKAPSADASAGYDVTPPASSANPISPYLWTSPSLVVNATANDALSGVSTVTLYYQFSPDNTTWGPCSSYTADGAAPWSWPFPFPEGGGFYRFHTIATDVAGNIEGGKSCLEAMAAYHLQLTPGHRLMSFPLAVSNDSVESVLSSISGCYDYVRWYDPLDSVDPWKSYRPGRAYNDLTHLDNTMGFWINITATCNFIPNGTRPVSTTIELHTGWNMVGFPSFNKTYTVSDMKADISVVSVVVEAFDASAGPYYLQRVSDDHVIRAGEGYWVYVPADATWTVDG